MNGAAFTSRYAFPPNELGYCGRPTFRAALRSFLEGRAGPLALEKEIRKFPVHYAYLRLISRENGLEPFDEKVVRAFWLGNGLLDSIGKKALERFIRRDLFKGRSPSRARRLCAGLPDGAVPHHSFNVLYVNFVTDSVERSARNFDSCCVTSGRVLSVRGKKALIERDSIGWEDGFVMKRKRSLVDLERSGVNLCGRLSEGDSVSVHWGMAVMKLGGRDVSALRRYNETNMDAINAAGNAGGRPRVF